MTTPTIENRAARHNYQVLETYEVGIILAGTEVKSVRGGKFSLSEAFAIVKSGELFLINAHIDVYDRGGYSNHTPTRHRKLLAHRSEIIKLQAAIDRKGLTLVPLKAYFKGSILKLELGICKGKSAPDKRESKKEQEAKREISRAIRERNRYG